MRLRISAISTMTLIIWLAGCAAQQKNVTRPEPRFFGKDLAVYQPPPMKKGPQTPETLPPFVEYSGEITLGQALALALMNNPELAVFSLEVRIREALALQAGLFPNPEFGVDVENFGGTGNNFQGVDESEITVWLGLLIELAGKRPKRKQVALLERDLADWDYEIRRIGVFTDTSKAFVDVLAAQERVSLSRELSQLAENVFDSVSLRARTGKISPLEKTKAAVALSNSRIELDRTNAKLEAARKRLSAAWGSTSPVFDKAVGRLDTPAAIPPEKQIERLVSNNQEIARWDVEMETRRADLTLEKARRIPNLVVSGGYRRLQETEDNVFVMGMSIPVPVFDRNQGGTLAAKYRLSKAHKKQTALRIQVQTELAEAYQRMSAVLTEANALKDDVLPGAQLAFDAAQEGFRQGKFGYLEVLDAQRTFFEAKIRYVEALAEFHRVSAEVAQLIGEPLESIEPIEGENDE